MAYTTAGGGGYGTGASVIHSDSSHSDYISVPDAELLFRGDFHRAGPDLILTGQDGRHHIIPDYFSSETHPALMAPNGATLSPDLVDLLAGSPTPGQYAQAQATAPADAIGKVEKVVGNATVMRNGVSVALHVGDAIFKSDVIQTGANSSCGIGFLDGTALDLVANTRMALNEYTFDPDGHSNSALFSLVEGTFAFVAGKVAHTGDMKIATPVATMGIRGTVGLVKKEISTFSANLGEVIYSILLHEDMDGSHHLGRIAVIDRDPTSPTFGEVIFLIADSSYVTYVMPQGPGLPPIVTTEPITDSRLFDDRHIFDDLGQILNYLLNGTNPQSNPSPGSGDNPNGLLPQYFQENNGAPFNINLPFNGPFGPGFGPITIVTFNTPPNNSNNTNNTQNNTTPPAGPDTFIWPSSSGSGTWDTGNDWNLGIPPTSSTDIVYIYAPVPPAPRGPVTYSDTYTIGTLVLEPGAALDIVGGSLTVGTVDDFGKIFVDGGSFDPLFKVTSSLTVEVGAEIGAFGRHAFVVIDDGSFKNSGYVVAADHGTVFFDSVMVTNESTGRIVSDDATMVFAGGGVTNGGKIVADHGGEIVFASIPKTANKIDVTNDGKIEATDFGKIDFIGDKATSGNPAGGGQVDNFALIEAKKHGAVTFDDIAVTNESDATIEAKDHGTVVFVDVAGADNGGLFNYGTIEALGWGSTVDFYHTDINGGTLEALGGTLFVSCDSTVYGDTAAGPVNVLISDGGIARFADQLGTDGTVDVTFGVGGHPGAGTLELHQAPGNGLAVSGFGKGDTIDLANLCFSTGEYVCWAQNGDSGTLTIHDGAKVETITLDGDYCQSDFVLLMDPTGGTEIVYGAADFWKSCESGCWTACGDWCDGVPTACSTAIIDKPVTVTLYTCAEVGNLVIGACASLDIVDCGSLTVLNAIDDSGTILVESHAKIDPRLTVDGPVTVEDTGKIEAHGSAATVEFHHDQVGNFGTIEATHRGTVTFDGSLVWNEDGGKIEASHHGKVFFDDATVTNEAGAKIEAKHRGTVTFNLGTVDNESCGTIVADGRGSAIRFVGDQVDNWGSIAAAWGGAVLFAGATIDNSRGGTIGADGRGSAVTFDGSLVDNSGRIGAEYRGTVVFDDSQVDNDRHGTIKADGWGSDVGFVHDQVFNSGRIVADHGGQVSFNETHVDNELSGKIEAKGWGSTVEFDGHRVDNAGLIEAAHRGTVLLDHTRVDNDGTIEALGWNSTVDIDHSTIIGGELLADGGKIVIDHSHLSDAVNVAITDGGIVDFASRLKTDATITFGVGGSAGAGTLELDQAFVAGITTNVPATVTNFGTDDVIDLTKISNGDQLSVSFAENLTGGILTVTDGTTGVTVNFTLVSNTVYNLNGFTLFSDPWGGTEVVYGLAVDVWSGDGDGTSWNEAANWAGDAVPGAQDTVEIFTPGSVVINDSEQVTIANLLIGAGATLEIDGDASLTVTNALDVSGTLAVDDAGSQFQVDGPVRVDSSAEMEATGTGAVIEFTDDEVGNAGTIEAEEYGRVLFDGTDVWNENGGTIEAAQHGKVVFAGGTLDNEKGATVVADGWGSKVKFFREEVDNWGSIAATCGAAVLFDHAVVDNNTVFAKGGPGIEAEDGGAITFKSSTILNSSGSQIAAQDGGLIAFDRSIVDNEHHGKIEADGWGSTVKFDHDIVDNSGRIEAKDGGTVWIDHSVVDNWGGTIAAVGCDTTVDLSHATIIGGTLETKRGGLIETVHGNTTFDDVTVINKGSIDVDLESNASTLTLENGTSVTGGSMVIGCEGILAIEGCAGATLDDVTVCNLNLIKVDSGSTASTLYLTDGTSITGGMMWIGSLGNVVVEAPGATLSGVAVCGGGTIDVGPFSVTTLNNPAFDADAMQFGDQALGVHSAGEVIGNFGNGSNNFQGFIYSDGTYTNLKDPCAIQSGSSGFTGTVAEGINGAGQVVGYYANAGGGPSGFLYSGGAHGTYTTLVYPTFSGSTVAVGINDGGLIVGDVYVYTNSTEAFIYNSGTIGWSDLLQDPNVTGVQDGTNPFGTYAVAINNSGQIVGNYYDTNDDAQGFIYSNGSWTNITDPSAFENASGAGVSGTYAQAINDAGQVVGYYVDAGGADHGFLYNDGNYLTLDDPSAGTAAGQGTVAEGINNAGEVVGYYVNAGGVDQAFVYNNGVFTDLDIAGAAGGSEALGINGSGEVVGTYFDATGPHGFLAVPATLTLEDGTTVTDTALFIAGGAMVDIEPGSDGIGATLDNVAVTNNGTINVDEPDKTTTLTVEDNTTITGGALNIGDKGTVDVEAGGAKFTDLDVTNNNVIEVGVNEAATLVLEDGTTVSGGSLTVAEDSFVTIEAGSGVNGNGATFDGVMATVDGTIQVDALTAATLTLTDGTTIDGDDNTGTLLIKGSGTVDVETGGAKFVDLNVTNNNIIEVGETADSIVKLKLDGTTIDGGTLATGGDPYSDVYGVIRVVGDDPTTFDGADNGALIVSGYVQVAPKAELELQGTIKLDGGASGLSLIELDQSMNGKHGATLLIDNNVTLKGDGYIALEGSETGIVASAPGATLTNDSSIYGAGQIGSDGDGSLAFVNNNVVDAFAGALGALVINTGDPTTNTGTLEATAASELDLYGAFSNTGGTIEASAQGLYTTTLGYNPTDVKLFSATIEGGTLLSDTTSDGAGGMIEIVNTGAGQSEFDGLTGQKVTVDAYVNVDSGATLELAGTIANEGTINVDGTITSVTTDLLISGTVKLNDGGTVLLDGVGDEITGTASGLLDNVDNTISGAGYIGDNTADLTFNDENNGTVDADVSSGKLTIETGGNQITNSGTFEATNGGILDIGVSGDDGTVKNGGGLLVADAGSTIDVVDAITGGKATIDSGTLEFDSSSNVNVTFTDGGDASTNGQLILGEALAYKGSISGFAGMSPSDSDSIDLVGINPDDVSSKVVGSNTVITINEGVGETNKITLDGFTGTLSIGTDGSTGTLITDPPATNSSNPSQSVSVNNESFTFHHHDDVGSGNSNSPAGTQGLGQWTPAQIQQWLAGNSDEHADAFVDFAHHDDGAGTSAHWHALVQNAVHLH